MKTNENQKHILALDGLRGLAVLSVIMVHVNLSFDGPTGSGLIGKPMAAILGCGWVGVDLFFVLSGFLITGILLDAKGSQYYLRNFWARRVLRILPLYLGYLFFLTVIAQAKPLKFLSQPIPADGMCSLFFYYYNFYAAFVRILPQAHHFWSLAVEEHFYIVWPIFVMVLPRRSLISLCVGGVVFSLALRVFVVCSGLWLQVAYLITPCRLDGLLAGAFVAIAVRDEVVRCFLYRYAERVMVGSGFFLFGVLLGQRHFLDFIDFRRISDAGVDSSVTLTVGITALSLFFATALARVIDSPQNSRTQLILTNDWLVRFGRYSYGMYVFHVFILSLTSAVLSRLAPSLAAVPGFIGKLLLAVIVLPVTFLFACVSYHLFEKRFLCFKKYFNYARSG
jgi:peptidoglycan/LPS O-acetylase OafA/YrhL